MTLALVVSLVAVLLAIVALVVAARSTRPAPATLVDPDALPEDVLGLRQEVAALRAEGADSLRNLAVVRYDAFGDLGGQLSWSLALVDASGSGIVLTAIHGRSDSRTYAKPLTGWVAQQPLSPEEEQAISAARPST